MTLWIQPKKSAMSNGESTLWQSGIYSDNFRQISRIEDTKHQVIVDYYWAKFWNWCAQDQSMPKADERFAPRKMQHGYALVGGATISGQMRCTLRDMSASGARLELPVDTSPYAITWPPKINIKFPLDRLEVDCVLVWRRNRGFAIKFCSPFRPAIRNSNAA